jgi:ribosomal protein S12 methylthiotransferase
MASRARTIHFVSLGCPKNRVDTEVMLGVALQAGWRHVPEAEDAEVIVVNSCGFIDAAKEESIQTILSLAVHKRTGRCRKLVVAGCLSQRYPDELARELAEVDHFLGSSDMLALGRVLSRRAARLLVGNPSDWLMSHADPRVLSTPRGSAYLRLAEGCSRRCAFCIIPRLRGPQRSRSACDVISEAQRLVDAGVLELNLICQDSSAYGRDRCDGASLAQVTRSVADLPQVRWVRILYLYPEPLPQQLISLWAEHPRVVPYVDMPLQHVSTRMLRRMRRGHGRGRPRELVEQLRRRLPSVVLRTAFIVGHPGETRADFDELCDFVRWAEFDHVGVFCYSDEEGTASHALGDKVAPRIAEARARKLMRLQRRVSRRKNRARIGLELEVLVEGPSEEHELVMAGRHAGQAPEVDGVVYLSGAEVHPGEPVRVRIVDAADYDLVGQVIGRVGESAAASQVTATARRAAAPPLVHRSSDGRRVLRSLTEHRRRAGQRSGSGISK